MQKPWHTAAAACQIVECGPRCKSYPASRLETDLLSKKKGEAATGAAAVPQSTVHSGSCLSPLSLTPVTPPTTSLTNVFFLAISFY